MEAMPGMLPLRLATTYTGLTFRTSFCGTTSATGRIVGANVTPCSTVAHPVSQDGPQSARNSLTGPDYCNYSGKILASAQMWCLAHQLRFFALSIEHACHKE
jgi:hypothetical protein